MTLLSSIAIYKGFEPTTIVSLLVLSVLICVSAFASGSETSLFSLSPTDIQSIKTRRGRSDRSILTLLSMEDRMLATILILNNLVNICIVIIANIIIDSLFRFTSVGWEFVIKTIAVTFVLLLFGEIMPKVAASHYPLRFARAVATPLLAVKSLLSPLSWLLVKFGGKINGRASSRKGNISMGELSDALEMTSNQSNEEKKMLSGIVDFVNTNVEDIMHPRLDITAINIESPYDEVKKTIIDSGFSRLPVYRDNIDNIEGVLYVKDMVEHIARGNDFEWQKHLRKAYYIPEHKKINDLLEEFQTNKIHLAIVVDEYGSTLGLLSLEDILEEIVGEITDESDKEHDFYTRVGENSYMFDGKTHIYDFLEVVGLADDSFDDVKGQAETIAGLMLEVKRDFLRRGDSITAHDVRFTAHTLDGRRITKVKVEMPEVHAPTA